MGKHRIPGQLGISALMVAKVSIDELIDFQLDICRSSLRPRNGQCFTKCIHYCIGLKKKHVVTQPRTFEAPRGFLGIQDMPQP